MNKIDNEKWGIRKIDLMEQKGRTVVIYGKAGRGKTTLLNTLSGNILLINIDCGEQVLNSNNPNNEFDICSLVSRKLNDPVVSITKLKDFVGHLSTLETLPWDYIVVDNISEVQDTILSALSKQRGKQFPEQLIYRDTGYEILKILKELRNLTYKGPDMIYIAWEDTIKVNDFGGEVQSEKGPMIMGKSGVRLEGLVDFVIAMRTDKKGTRYLQLDADNKYAAKKRTEPGKVYPNLIECPLDSTDTLQTLFELIHGGNKKKTDKQTI
jgi:phage nucleotide-binding protein